MNPSGYSGVVTPCPRKAVEAEFLDEQDHPVADILVRLRRSPGQVSDQFTDSRGRARFEGIDPDSYEFVFPELDQDAWSFIRQEPLTSSRPIPETFTWNSPPDAPTELDSVTAEDAACVTSIAFDRGFNPETVWNYGPNAKLKQNRESMNILEKGDVVAIPKRRIVPQPCQTGNRFVMRLAAYPAMLRVRFVDDCLYPRKNVSYLLIIEASHSAQIPDRRGETDSDGFLREPIPPDAVRGEIWVGTGKDREVWPVDLGSVRPNQLARGIKTRLNNLGYGFPAGSEEEFGAALRAFQRDSGLMPTGQPDQETYDKLKELHLS